MTGCIIPIVLAIAGSVILWLYGAAGWGLAFGICLPTCVVLSIVAYTWTKSQLVGWVHEYTLTYGEPPPGIPEIEEVVSEIVPGNLGKVAGVIAEDALFKSYLQAMEPEQARLYRKIYSAKKHNSWLVPPVMLTGLLFCAAATIWFVDHMGWRETDGECRTMPECDRDGKCRQQGEDCVAKSDSDCEKSWACDAQRRCVAYNGECVVKASTSSDCDKTHGRSYNPCQHKGRCTAKDGVCVAATREDCMKAFGSPNARLDGDFVAGGACKGYGLCTPKNGKCVSTDDDCQKSGCARTAGFANRWKGCATGNDSCRGFHPPRLNPLADQLPQFSKPPQNQLNPP